MVIKYDGLPSKCISLILRIIISQIGLLQRLVLGKTGLAGPILDEKLLQADHFLLTKYSPAGPIFKPGMRWSQVGVCLVS